VEQHEMISGEIHERMRIPYALRHVPEERFATLLPQPSIVSVGDIILARLEKIGKNSGLELRSGRRSTLHEGDLLALVFGNRYATRQFEGYARTDGDRCHMLSMGGLCGMVESKHASVAEPTKLRILGAIGDADGQPLNMRDYALPRTHAAVRPKVIAVCGSSMDAGKTYTTMSTILGLQRKGHRVAGIKLTGTAAGRDIWSMADAGACVALDFVDGGWPATYLCSLDELLDLYGVLVDQAAAKEAEWVVMEMADGLLQRETAALLQSPRFTSTVHSWLLAASEPMSAANGVSVLRGWDIEPVALSGIFSMSPLGIQEAHAATGLLCVTAKQLQSGELNSRLMRIEDEHPDGELDSLSEGIIGGH
jgi:hypothetical protein